MSLPATPPPNQLLKSSPGPPRSPPAPLQPQNAETVEVSDSGDSDNEDLKKAKQLSNSRKAPNFLTFNFPVNISSILQQYRRDRVWPKHGPLYSEAFTDPAGVQWRAKMLTPGTNFQNPDHMACFLEIAPGSSLKPGLSRHIAFSFEATRAPTAGAAEAEAAKKAGAAESSDEVLSISDSPESVVPAAPNGAATPPLQPAGALAAPTTPVGGVGSGNAASDLGKVQDKHVFMVNGERDWGFWKAFEAVNFLPSIGACEGPFQVIAELHDVVPLPPYDSKKSTGMVGLKNQGATCYMNSLLQSLFHLTSLRSAVYAMPTEDLETDSMALALQRVFVQLQTIETAVSTKELTKTFGWDSADAFMQQDVQELNRILCDRLEEKMKGTSVEGTIARLFEGKVRSFIRCLNVPYESAREETFYDISLDVKGCRDVEESFRKYVETEKLEGENQYDAVEHGKQDAEKGVSFVSFPPVLNLQLKRFDFDMYTGDMVKINDRFEFPERLDLTPFLNKDKEGEEGGEEGGGGVDNRGNVYLLHSVLVHSGDVNAGHYYSYIKPQKGFVKAAAMAQKAREQKHANANNGGGKGQYFRFDDDEVRKATVMDAVEGSFGGPKSALPAHKNNAFNSWTSAYMLVYVRESELSELMQPVPKEAIPAHLTQRFVREEGEKAAALAARKEAHKYMDVHITCAEDVAQLDRFASSYNDFVPASNCGYTVKIKKEAEVWQLLATIEIELGIPIDRMRLWNVEQRDNHSRRPMDCLEAENLTDIVAKKYTSESNNGRCVFYMEVLPESGEEFLDLDAPFTGLQPFPPKPPCNSLPHLAATAYQRHQQDTTTAEATGAGAAVTAKLKNSDLSTAAAFNQQAITKAREDELYDPNNRGVEAAKVGRKFRNHELSSTHGMIFVKFYNPDYVRAMHGGDGRGEGGFLLPGSGTRPHGEREFVFLGSALVRTDAIARQVLPQVCAALLSERDRVPSSGGDESMGDGEIEVVERDARGGGASSPSLRLIEAIKIDELTPIGKGTLKDCELDDGDIICCQKQSDVTTVLIKDDEEEGAELEGGGGAAAMVEEAPSDVNSLGFVTLPAPGSVMPLPRKVEDYYKYRVHRRILRLYPNSAKEPRAVSSSSSSLLPLPSPSMNGHDPKTAEEELPKTATAAAAEGEKSEDGGFALGVTGGFELELSSMMTVEQVLAAIANAVGLTEPLRLKLWGVNGVGETPQPLHSPYNICEHHLPNRAFDSHGIKLEGGKKYGSNGVLFYQVFPYDILQLRDNVAVELEVAHQHWARIAGTCANDKDLGTPFDVATEDIASLWPDQPPISLLPSSSSGHGDVEAAGVENGSGEPHSPPLLLLPPERIHGGDEQSDDYFARTREVDGGERVLTKFDPLGGTCSITFLVPRDWTVRDVVESARRLLRVPLHYKLRLNEVNRLLVGGTLKGKQPVGDVTRSPLHSAHCNLRNTPPAIVKTSLEIVDSDELVGVPEDSNWIQVVVFSLTREASRKRKQRLAANAAGAAAAASLPKDEDKADSNEDNDEMTAAAAAAAAAVVAENNKASEESVSWDVDLHGIGHLTYISPHDGVNAVRSRVLDRVPPHFRDLITSPSSRPAIVRDDGKATFLTTWDLPPWQEGDETDTSELYARVGRILEYQRNMSYPRRPALGFEIPAPETERKVKKSRRLDEGIRINC